MQAISMRKCFKHKPLLWGAHILTWPQEKHAKLCASLITFYPICMDVQTDAMKPHQPYPWTIGSMQSAIANAIPTLWPSFLPPWHAFPLNHVCPFITNYLPSSIHFSSILKENLYHLFAPFLCWYVQRSGAILRRSNMVSKCKHTKEDVQQTNPGQYPFIALFFTFKKMQTQHWLSQSITHLPACYRKDALSIGTTHWCTNVLKDANHMACLVKAMLWMTFFAFKENSSAVHTQTQQ